MLCESVDISFCNEVVVSYLPLSHIAAQILDLYLTMKMAATVYFAQPDALRVCSHSLLNIDQFIIIIYNFNEQKITCSQRLKI